MSSDTQARGLPLGKNRDYTIFLIGQTISHVGNAIHYFILPLLVLEVTGSIAQMGLVTTTAGIARFLAGLFCGELVDRYDRRRLMLLCDVASIVVSLTIPALWAFGFTALWAIYVVAFWSGALGTCFLITQLSSLPSLVGKSHITAANGRMMAGYGAAMLLGPLIGGHVSFALGPAPTLLIDVFTFMISAASLMLIRFRMSVSRGAVEPDVRPRDEQGREKSLVAVRYLWREPTLRAVALLSASSLLLVSGGVNLIIFHLKENMGHGDRAVGMVLGIAAVGAIASGVLAAMLRRTVGFGAMLLGSIVFQGVCVAMMGVVNTVFLLAALAVFYAFANSLIGICSMTIRQELTPDHLLGRMTSVFWVLSSAAGSIGIAASSLLAEYMGVLDVLLLMGICTVMLGLFGLLSPARHRQPPPARHESGALDKPNITTDVVTK
jgi:MFS family permease